MPKEGVIPGEDETYIPIWAPAKSTDPYLKPTTDVPSPLLGSEKIPQEDDKLATESPKDQEATAENPPNPKAEALAIFLATIARQTRRK
jgi:hypothetical protein